MVDESNQKAEGAHPKCDNNNVIQLSKKKFYHEGTKYIDTKLHFVREDITL